MNSLRTLALAHTTANNAGYNEAVQIARAATMEGNGAVLRDYYTFEEYIARRGNFIHKLPQYKHLNNACWVVRKNDARFIFEHEQQQLTVREVRRRELANEVEPLLPLPTTSNTESLDNFRYCRPEGWPGWRADDDEFEVEDEAHDPADWYVKTPGGSEAFYTPATSPVEGNVVVDTTSAAAIAIPETAVPTTGHADLVEPLRQNGGIPAPSIGSDGLDVNHTVAAEHSIDVSSITVSKDQRSVVTYPATNVDGINGVRLSADYSLTTTNPSINPVGPTVSNPRIPTSVGVIDTSMPSADYGSKTPTTANGDQTHKELNVPRNDANTPAHKTPNYTEAQATPAASLTEPHITPAKTFKPNWKALSTGTAQSDTTRPPVEPPASSPAKVKIFTPDPRVSSMARYGIVAPIKKKEDSKHTEQSPSKPATPVASTAAPTAPIEVAPESAPQPKSFTTTAPAVHIKTAPAPAPLPEISTNAVTPTQNPDIPQDPAEPAQKRQKGIRGVAHPVKTPASAATKNKPPLTKTTPTPTPNTDSPSTAPTKLARRLASIIAGASLPKTKAEARAAATEHHTRLLAQHNSQPPAAQPEPTNRRTSARILTKPTANPPDLMPFFFSRPGPADATTGTGTGISKKGEQQQQQQDFIRCVCGVRHDDGEHMICCEACEVWQHSACVVPGLAEAKLEALRWECTVCDPWGNRKILKRLRAAAAGLVVEGKRKEVKGGKRRVSAGP